MRHKRLDLTKREKTKNKISHITVVFALMIIIIRIIIDDDDVSIWDV